MSDFLVAQAVTDTCGADPGAVCSLILDLSGNSQAARIADLAARPIKVVLILVVAWIVNRLVRRWLDRAVEGWLTRRAEAAEEAREISDEASGPIDELREAALRRAHRMVEKHERAGQRTRTLGALLRSVASVAIYGLAVMMALGACRLLGCRGGGVGLLGGGWDGYLWVRWPGSLGVASEPFRVSRRVFYLTPASGAGVCS